ncbi:MAG: hypothetical protein AAF493_22595 [Pseudomonadota bacterium]
MRVFLVTIFGLGLCAEAAFSATAWDESANGDLSTDPFSPTNVSLEVGANTVQGTVVTATDTRDYLTFDVGPGRLLTNIVLTDYLDVTDPANPVPGNRGFVALDDGSTSAVPTGGTIGEFLGGDHLDAADVGNDLLAQLALAPLGGSGFTTPLGEGTYTLLVQQTGPQVSAYGLELTVVPLPGALPLFGGALAWLGFKRWRQTSRKLGPTERSGG